MSHGDQLSEIPPTFQVIGKTSSAPFAAIVHKSKPIYGIQFHPEVTHSPRGKEVIARFVLDIVKCKPSWTMVCVPHFAEAFGPPTYIKNSHRNLLLVRRSIESARFVVRRVVSSVLSVVELIAQSPLN